MILPILYTFKGKIFVGIATLSTVFAISEVVLGQLIASIPPTAAVLISLYVLVRKQDKIAEAVDGKLTRLMTAEKGISHAEGAEKERTEERARQGDAAIAKAEQAPAEVIIKNPINDPAKTSVVPLPTPTEPTPPPIQE